MSTVRENAVLFAGDTVFAAEAECYVTIDGRRYNFMQAINVEAKVTKIKQKYLYLEKLAKETNQQDGKVLVQQPSTTILLFSAR